MRKGLLRAICFTMAFLMVFLSVDMPVFAEGISEIMEDASVENADEVIISADDNTSDESSTTEEEDSAASEGSDVGTTEETGDVEEPVTIEETENEEEPVITEETENVEGEQEEYVGLPESEDEDFISENYPLNGLQVQIVEVDFDALGIEEIEITEPGEDNYVYDYYATSPYADWRNASSYYVYMKLDDYEKSLWDTMEAEYTSYLEGNKTLGGYTSYINIKQSKMTKDEAIGYLLMFKYTHPEYYFLNDMISMQQSGTTTKYAFGVYEDFRNGSARNAASARIDAVLDDWCAQINKCATEEAKVLKLNELICNKVSYNYAIYESGFDEESQYSQSAYSVFCTDLTVCAGYSLSFEWVANMCGIDSIAVTSPGHAWNKVRVNDNWYNIDVTANDQKTAIYYIYYLRSDAFVDSRGGHTEESQWDGLLPECTLDSGSDGNKPGSLPVINNQVSAPVITATPHETGYTVDISCATPGAVIYYTTDGTEPSEARTLSKIYTGPFDINMNGEIKAIAVCNEYTDSTITVKELEAIIYTVASGSCGSNLTWKLDSIGYLEISGSGSMKKYSSATAYPWGKYASDIHEVVLEYGITSIAQNAFSKSKNLAHIYIPQTVTTISGGSVVSTATITGHPDGAAAAYAEKYGNSFLDITAYGICVKYVTGYSATVDDQYYLDGSYAKAPIIQRDGYDFNGWYTSATVQNDSTKWNFENTILENDVTLYGKWTAQVYQLSFDANYTGAEKIASRNISYDATYATLPVLERTGYSFDGWYTKASGGALVTNDNIFQSLTDVTLYAHWTVQSYTVSFEANGGIITGDTSKVVTYDTKYGTLPVVTREGYTFKGWYNKAIDGELVTKDTVLKIGNNHTIYAYWTANTYKVTLELDGGSAEGTEPFTATYDAAYGPLPNPTREGYTFEGWYTEDNKLVNKESLVKVAKDHTLTAKWLGVPVVVTFESGEGNLSADDLNLRFGSAYGTLPTPRLTGYTFDGWYTATSGGTLVTAESIVSDTKNHTLYAQYSPNEYNIIFDVAGTSAVVEPICVKYNSTYGELPNPEIAGGIFLGWYTEAVGGKKVNSNDIVKILEDQVLYAHWEFTYKVVTPSGNYGDGAEVAKGTRISLTTETNGAFIYYTTDPMIGMDVNSENGTLYEDAIIIEEDITIYAIAIKAQHKDSDVIKVSYSVIDDSQDWGDITEEDKAAAGYVTTDDVPKALWVVGVSDCDYTGKAISFGDMRVYDYKTLLMPQVDYTVKYANNTKAGTATITITGKGNYAGTIVKTFQINPLDISEATVEDVVVAYNEKVQKAPAKVIYTLNGEEITLKAGTDYTCVYPGTDSKADDYDSNAFKAADVYEVTIVGKGNYTGTTTYNQTISEKYMIGKMNISAIANQEYTGTAIEPMITIMDGSDKLVEDTDYTVKFRNNIAVGTATVVITGIGEYAGSVEKTFKITGIEMKKVSVSGLDASMVYDGSEMVQSEYVLSYTTGSGDEAQTVYLQEGIDYTVSYLKNDKVGTANIIFTGINGYTGTIKKSFKITKYDFSSIDNKVSVAEIETQLYVKGGSTPKPVVTYAGEGGAIVLTEGKDYTLSYSNNKGIADKTALKAPMVTIKGKGNFSGSMSVKFSIVASDLDEVTITANDIVYKKKAGTCKPTITLLDTNGKKLAAGTDYSKTITYVYAKDTEVVQIVNRKEIRIVRREGDAVEAKDIIPVGAEITATITGMNLYNGTKTVNFRYVTQNVSSAKVTVEVQTYTGKAVEPSKDDMVVKIGKTVLAKTDYEILGYENNVNKGTGKVIIRGIGNYGGIKTVSFKINNKSMNYTIVYDQNAADATGKMKTSSTAIGKAITANGYKRAGYVFVGWNTKPDGSGVSYTNKEKFYLKDGVSVYGVKVTLYAQWKKL